MVAYGRAFGAPAGPGAGLRRSECSPSCKRFRLFVSPPSPARVDGRVLGARRRRGRLSGSSREDSDGPQPRPRSAEARPSPPRRGSGPAPEDPGPVRPAPPGVAAAPKWGPTQGSGAPESPQMGEPLGAIGNWGSSPLAPPRGGQGAGAPEVAPETGREACPDQGPLLSVIPAFICYVMTRFYLLCLRQSMSLALSLPIAQTRTRPSSPPGGARATTKATKSRAASRTISSITNPPPPTVTP